MKRLLHFLLLLLTLLLTACGTAEEPANGDSSASVEYYTVKATEAEATEGDFIYRLVSEKEEYASGGPVELYAELEYIGDLETIDIFHAASPFYFPMEEKTRSYEIHYGMEEPLITTTLTKGEPLREQYSGSGGYSAEEDSAYIEFTKNIIDMQFPEGYYVVDGYTDFYTENSATAQTKYEMHAEVDFKVLD
ncbi:hypothetical protein [Planomicrobium sp. MB-3u-38]|uniref:hypothetical protein n=1 Tax=Planomicrobium sp. MB-3u-38 TaxID=2058318 RepID=UPI000C79DF22|nr:hypothetical protein [Planomicrobium sp. MB-3u-38]PKH10831.1 hypothetical protein CXF70_07630 [Planomicrobium sp. MB-3u-38]